jgi:hypothetical protein
MTAIAVEEFATAIAVEEFATAIAVEEFATATPINSFVSVVSGFLPIDRCDTIFTRIVFLCR